MDCSTIIVSYNTFDLTREAIRTALAAAPGLIHEVIVVDNNSPDDSAERLAEAYRSIESVRVLANGTNRGFSAANNQGASHASGDVLLFLNPDTVVHDRAVTELVKFVRGRPDAGAVGPRVLNADGSIQVSAMFFPTPRWMLRHHLPLFSLLRGLDRRADPIPQSSTPVDVVKGCAIAVSRQAFDAIGGWDERYFMYAEELELCRALTERGYTNYYVIEAEITHYGGAASLDRYAEEQVRIAESTYRYLERNSPSWHRRLYRATGWLGFSVRWHLFRTLASRQPGRSAEFERRGEAARSLAAFFRRGLENFDAK